VVYKSWLCRTLSELQVEACEPFKERTKHRYDLSITDFFFFFKLAFCI